MQRTRGRTWVVAAIVAAPLMQAACGGGSQFGDSGLFDQIEVDDIESGDMLGSEGGDSEFGQSVVGALEAGAVTVAAEPGHAVVTVDGRAIDHTPVESGETFRCVFSDDQITLEVNSAFGSMILSASRTDDGWLGTFTADSDESEAWIQYSAQPFDGELGIDPEAKALSYVGTAIRQDRDAMSDGDLDTPTVDVTVAVNCGIDPAIVEVGGQTLTFAPFEADSMTCQVAGPDSIGIVLSSLSTQDRQLQFDVRPEGDGVIGGVNVIEGDERWSATISTFGETADGLTVDGSTVTFTGTFERTSDVDPDLSEEFEGTATVTCPS